MENEVIDGTKDSGSSGSGRERKRVRRRHRRPTDKRSKFVKRTEKILWIVLLVGFVTSLFVVLPAMIGKNNRPSFLKPKPKKETPHIK